MILRLLAAAAALALLASGHDQVPQTWSYQGFAPQIQRSTVVSGVSSPFHYNHDSSVVWWRGLFYVLWNANTVSAEGRKNQYNLLSVSADAQHWSEPVKVFSSNATSSNPIPCHSCTQWQPNFVLVNDSLLVSWCLHSSDEYAGTYMSVLRDPRGKWENRMVLFDGKPELVRNNVSWFGFPTQDPIVLQPSGRILAPVTFTADSSTVRENAVLFSDDGGQTWQTSEFTGLPHEPSAQWEPTVYQRTGSAEVVMLARNNLNMGGKSPVATVLPTQKLLFATSLDDGVHWTPMTYVPLESITSRAHVWGGPFLAPTRHLLVLNDAQGDGLQYRQNVALYTRPRSPVGPGVDFVPGVSLTGLEPVVAYPQMSLFNNGTTAVMVYSQGYNFRSIRSLTFDIPQPEVHYIFPRNNALPFCPRPDIDNKTGILDLHGFQKLAFSLPAKTEATFRDFSIGGWVRLADGPTTALVDTRTRAQGVVFGAQYEETENNTMNLFVNLDTQHNLQATTVNVTLGEWAYVGVSVSATQGTIDFVVNGSHSGPSIRFNTTAFPAFFLGQGSVGGSASFHSSLHNITGQLRSMTLVPAALSVGQHITLANAFAGSVGAAPFAGAQPWPAGLAAVLQLDATNATALQPFSLPPACPDTAELVTAGDTLPLLRVCGRGSAGVELPPHTVQQNNISVAARWSEVAGSVDWVLLTVGDGDTPTRLFTNASGTFLAAYSTSSARWLGQVHCGPRLAAQMPVELRVQSARQLIQARVNNLPPCSLQLPPAAALTTWLFVGDGFLSAPPVAAKSGCTALAPQDITVTVT
eukprot:m.27482 g.27482  ORF g.27482 m.27482 type:complete len:807 (-) comp11670_c0_seq1:30-2450(-)